MIIWDNLVKMSWEKSLIMPDEGEVDPSTDLVKEPEIEQHEHPVKPVEVVEGDPCAYQVGEAQHEGLEDRAGGEAAGQSQPWSC